MCDIQTAMAVPGGKKMKIDIDKQCVQMVAIAGLTVLGSVAIIVDGEVGNVIAIAIAGAVGYLARSLFPGGETNEAEVPK